MSSISLYEAGQAGRTADIMWEVIVGIDVKNYVNEMKFTNSCCETENRG